MFLTVKNMKNMLKCVKNMKKQFGSKKMSKFMTANQLFMKNIEKTCFLIKMLIRSHEFTHFFTPKLKKHVFLLILTILTCFLC